MDAVHPKLQKIALFLVTALLLTAPVNATTPVLSVSTTTVTLGSATCNNNLGITVASSDTAIQFTVGITYNTGDVNGNWLYASVPNFSTTTSATTFTASAGSTGVTLNLGLNRTLTGTTDSAKVVLTPISPAGAPITIQVYYQQNPTCSGNTGSATNGFIQITPGTISLTAALGLQQSQTMTIQNLTPTGANNLAVVAAGGNWLTASPTSPSISPNGSTSVSVTGDASQVQTAGTYYGTVTITPPAGFGGAISISVTFVVTGSGTGPGNNTGTLTVNGSTSNTYTLPFTQIGGGAQASVNVGIQDTAANATSYQYSTNTLSGGAWLLANYNTSGTQTANLAPSANAQVTVSLSNVAATLASGAYRGTITLTSISGSTATITVNLYVSAGTAPGISVSPQAVFNFPSVPTASTTQQSQSFTVTAASGYTLGAPILSTTAASNGFSISGQSSTSNSSTFTITSNPSGLQDGLYSAVITLNSSGTTAGTTSILVSLSVGGTGSTTTNPNSQVAPTALAFQYQASTPFGNSPQTITITGAQGGAWSSQISYITGGNWLQFTNTSYGTFGTGPATLIADLYNGVTGLAASSTPYTANIAITTPSGTYTVSVSVLVTAANTDPVLIGKPATLTFTSNNGSTPSSQISTVVGSDNFTSISSPTITVGTPTVSWATATSNGNTMTVSVNPSGQATGIYWGTIPVSASAYHHNISFPVVLVVNGGSNSGGVLTLSTSALSFPNLTASSQKTVTVTGNTATTFSASTTETSCTSVTWLSIAPVGSLTATPSGQTITVTANPSGINNGTTCNGTVNFLAAGVTQTVAVTMTVGAGTGSGEITLSQTTVPFTYTQQQTVPSAQTVALANAITGTAAIPFTVTITQTESTSVAWLKTDVTSGQTPYNLSISVAPGNLNTGTYHGTVTINPTGGSAKVVNVTLQVNGAAVVTATPTSLPLSYQVGGSSPTATIQVSAGGAAAGFTAVASSSTGWLKVSPTSGTTPNTGTFNLNVTLDPTALAALLPATYTGTITTAAVSPATGTTITNVTLTVSAPLPAITGVINAASGSSTGTVAPGEIISLFANPANPIGPTGGNTTQLDSTGKVATTLAGVQVVFLPSGYLAPLTFVNAGQINCVVPYGLAGQTSTSVQVRYLGQTSNAWPLSIVATSPGVFTANSSGSGQAAVLQYDTTGTYKGVNSAGNPAQKGWILAIYLTGEGAISVSNPISYTGTVTQATSVFPYTPQPFVTPITVLLDSQPASVPWYGEAPSLVSGVLQVNVVVPNNVHSGNDLISLSLGTQSTQAQVTVAIQ